MAHTKAQRAVRGNRDSNAKRLGVKIYGGQKVRTGSIIVRQKGSKFHAGENVLRSRDFTLQALTEGTAEYYKSMGRSYVRVVADAAPAEPEKKPARKTAKKTSSAQTTTKKESAPSTPKAAASAAEQTQEASV